jgi:hypothetical protein
MILVKKCVAPWPVEPEPEGGPPEVAAGALEPVAVPVPVGIGGGGGRRGGSMAVCNRIVVFGEWNEGELV